MNIAMAASKATASEAIPVEYSSTITNSDVTDVKKKRKVLRHSNYFITINTNKGFILQSDAEPLTRELKTVIDRMMVNVLDYISCEELDASGQPLQLDDTLIKGIKIQAVAEIGEKSYQPHAHIMIAISHYTKVKVDYAKLKNDVKEGLGIQEDIYFNSKLYRDANAEIADYMAKTIRK